MGCSRRQQMDGSVLLGPALSLRCGKTPKMSCNYSNYLAALDRRLVQHPFRRYLAVHLFSIYEKLWDQVQSIPSTKSVSLLLNRRRVSGGTDSDLTCLENPLAQPDDGG